MRKSLIDFLFASSVVLWLAIVAIYIYVAYKTSSECKNADGVYMSGHCIKKDAVIK